MTRALTLIISAAFSLASLAVAQSTVPSGMTYQGRLTDASNAPVPDGNGYEIEVRLWSTPVAGPTQVLLWGTRYTGVPLKSGAFNLILGSGGTPIPGATTTDLKAAFNTPTVHLGLTTTKSATGAPIPSPTEILPRQQIFSAPYAFNSAAVGNDGVNSAAIKDGEVNPFDLSASTRESLCPAGSIMPFVGIAAPPGWLLCDGAEVERQQYPTLFTVIGESHGSGDGTTTFNLPDFRGRFLRGVDGPDGTVADRDPDSASRQQPAPGGNAVGVGSIQGDQTKEHSHFTVAPGNISAGDIGGPNESIASLRQQSSGGLINENFEYEIGGRTDEPTTGRTDAPGGAETRPKNSAVNFIIKY